MIWYYYVLNNVAISIYKKISLNINCFLKLRNLGSNHKYKIFWILCYLIKIQKDQICSAPISVAVIMY